MKKGLFSAASITLLFFSLFLTSCNKYEEGPTLSLRSPESRITGTWMVTKATETTSGGDSFDRTSDYSGETYALNDDATFTYDGTAGGVAFSYSGSWNLLTDNTQLHVHYSYVFIITITVDLTYDIMRLTGKELIIEYTDGGGSRWRYEFEKQ